MVEFYNSKLIDGCANWREMAAYCRSIYLRDFPKSKATDIGYGFEFEITAMVFDETMCKYRFTWGIVCARAMGEVMDMMPQPAMIYDMKNSFTGSLTYALHSHQVTSYETFDALLTISSSLAPKIIK